MNKQYHNKMLTNYKNKNNKMKVKIYDPAVNAYRTVSVEEAERFIASAKEAEKIIKEQKNA